MRGLGVIARRRVVLGVVLLTLIAGALVIERPWEWCPSDYGDAARIQLLGSDGDVTLDGREYRVSGTALLDYMPRALVTPLDRLLYQMRGERHPLGVTAGISAGSRDALGDPEFTCFRATRGSDVWARRPTTHGTQQLSDALPPGGSPPARNEAWRQASANDGPEWPAGERIGLELWATVNGRHYIFVVLPFELMKGL